MENKWRTFNICLLGFLKEENGENVGEIRFEILEAALKTEYSGWKHTLNTGSDKKPYT